MHATAMTNARRFVDRYLSDKRGLSVLDVGGADVNGSLRSLFEDRGHTYMALDVREDQGVDIVAKEGEPFPLNDNDFDVIVSSSMMEHDPAFWRTFDDMVRVCKIGGLIYLCVPSRGGHHWGRDCWRFIADAYPALESWNGRVTLLSHYIDPKGHWGDNVGVFQKYRN